MFEYKVIGVKSKRSLNGGKFDKMEIERVLNEMGQQDWELVNISAVNKGIGETGKILAFFKRRITKIREVQDQE